MSAEEPALSFESGATESERTAVIAALTAVYSPAITATPEGAQTGRWAEPPANHRWAPRGRAGWRARRSR